MRCRMRYFLIISIFLFFIPDFLFAEVKDYVAVVKPVYHEKTRKNFLSIADYFEEANNKTLADIFRSFAEGGHGSGFIFVDENGDNYIITSRHVVIQAEKVNIEFENPDGTFKPYYNCPIVYVDDELDLAVLQFPNRERIFKEAFELDVNIQRDGKEVWSVGFPGLLGKPGWQFARGNITNKSARIPEMVDPDISYVIQHSAPIDPGNSGGPLLIETVSGYKVVGINTWIVSNRQNTFFSLPAKHILNVLDRARKAENIFSDPSLLKEKLEETCNILAAELGSENPDWDAVKRYISYSFVSESGWNSFISILNVCNEEESEKWKRSFYNYSPIETMRTAIYILFWYTIRESEEYSKVKFEDINYADSEKLKSSPSSSIRTNFKINDKEAEMIWKFEFGHWRISYMKLQQFGSLTNRFKPERSLPDMKEEPRNFGLGLKVLLGSQGAVGDYWDQSDVVKNGFYGLNLSWSIGIFVDIPISTHFGFSSGLVYTKKGVAFEYSTSDINEKWEVHYLQVPLLFKLKFPYADRIALYNIFFGAGAGYDHKIYAGGEQGNFDTINLTSSYFKDLNPFNISLLVTAGIERRVISSPITFGLDCVYDLYLLNDWKKEHFPDNRNSRFHSISFGGHIKYSLK